MMTDGSTSYDQPDVPTPAADLKALGERLVGAWRVTGGAEGTVRFEWMQGGFFLVQHVELEQYGQRIGGIEVVGHLRPFGEPPTRAIHSRFYDSTGNTLDYVYELDGGTLTIWAGEKGSPAYYRGTFSPDGNSQTGAWVSRRRRLPGDRHQDRGLIPQRQATTVLVAEAETDRFASAL